MFNFFLFISVVIFSYFFCLVFIVFVLIFLGLWFLLVFLIGFVFFVWVFVYWVLLFWSLWKVFVVIGFVFMFRICFDLFWCWGLGGDDVVIGWWYLKGSKWKGLFIGVCVIFFGSCSFRCFIFGVVWFGFCVLVFFVWILEYFCFVVKWVFWWVSLGGGVGVVEI